MTLWIYLYFPKLQLDRRFFLEEEKAQAAIIVDGQDSHVVQLNQPAEEAGIALGMGLGTAASLCHPLQVLPHQAEVEQQKLEEIAHWLYMVTSDITLFSSNGILLRVTNMLSLYSGLEKYWQVVQQHLAKLEVEFHFSTGYSPLMAQVLAENGLNQLCDIPAQLAQLIRSYPLTATQLSPKVAERLQRVGIKQLKHLLDLPMAELAKRFDIDLVNFVGRLTGQFKHPVTFYHPKHPFKRHLDLLYEIENVQWLEKPLYQLFVQLEAYLKLRDQLAHELTLSLRPRDGEPLILTLHSAQGDYQADKWQQLSQLNLESIKLTAPVLSISLTATQVAAQQGQARDLFSGNREQGQSSPLELVSLLQAKLGQEAVKGIGLGNDARPEMANQYCTPLAKQLDVQIDAKALRPNILLPSPQPLSEPVTIIQGPERIATGWWDNNPIVRDYFIAHSQIGRWLWVFRTPQQQWFLHGYFS